MGEDCGEFRFLWHRSVVTSGHVANILSIKFSLLEGWEARR